MYWHMEWHTEHHAFPNVPCYNLKALHRSVAHDLPKPRTLFGAWKEMRQTWKRQQVDPGYQYETPLPRSKKSRKGSGDMESSLGDFPPETLD